MSYELKGELVTLFQAIHPSAYPWEFKEQADLFMKTFMGKYPDFQMNASYIDGFPPSMKSTGRPEWLANFRTMLRTGLEIHVGGNGYYRIHTAHARFVGLDAMEVTTLCYIEPSGDEHMASVSEYFHPDEVRGAWLGLLFRLFSLGPDAAGPYSQSLERIQNLNYTTSIAS